MSIKGENERLLYEILNEAYPDEWKSDCTFLHGRKYRGDAVNEKRKIIIEIEGGIWLKTPGRHNQPLGYIQDLEKYNAALIDGWKVLRYCPDTLRRAPWKIIKDVRVLCGVSEDASQTKLSLDGLKQTKIGQIQVSLS